ncbi:MULTISPECIES: TonB-dependent receptor domain-containing protein [Pseudomonadati]|uniref:TonB-dependent receptor n=1 Tax=Shewanella aestuarii TaxID=1028752 RepID=A0ABT0L4A8_9GAMM|nr:TonB-dependent receptor [Shewanella aestuarii]MCL1118330.1 TonB-dependent receptor [Shewanella aestuarii]GGN80555.1 TonB-dependent receptor [Shewanella aestuarii]
MKFNKIAKLVSLACGGLAALSLPAHAVEAETDSNVERIEVTGSRLKRVDMEGANPVTTITADEMATAGFSTVGDALRASTLNSFGSYGGTSNNSWSSQATIQLKGADASHTLTLLNGKRMAKSPVLGGGATNINTIPTAAVERIEILSDGASAIYGTDAIAGVINIILKKDFEGVEVKLRAEEPDAEGGGDNHSASFTGGLSSDKGHLMFTIEHFKKSGILFADRPYTAAHVKDGEDPTDFRSWIGLSQTGRTIDMGPNGGWEYQTPFTNAGLDCKDVYGDNFTGPLNDSNYGGETSCAYDYTKAAYNDVDQERTSTLINYNYDFSDDIQLTARAYWASNTTTDVSAPIPGYIVFPQAMPAYTTSAGLDLRAVPEGGAMLYRFDTAGNRVRESTDNIYDFLVGLDGTTDSFDWNTSVSYNKYDVFKWGTGYQLKGATTDLVGAWNDDTNSFDGWDPRDPNSKMPGGATANSDARLTSSALEIDGGLSFELFELSGGATGLYLGASYREEALDSQVDALDEAGLIAGGSGGAGGSGDRDVKAVFMEMVFPVLDNLEVNLAARYDEYSDFGGTFNPQVSLRYNVLEPLLLRASWGTGFRAPTLEDLNQSTSVGYNNVTNYLKCYEDGLGIDGCNIVDNVPVSIERNENLGPEESESYNFGMVWDIADSFNMTMDYWSLETTGLIGSLNNSEITRTQAELWKSADDAGQPRPDVSAIYPGTSISQNGAGKLTAMTNVLQNIGLSERQGLDTKFAATFDSEVGEFKLGLAWSHYLKYTDSSPEAGVQTISRNWSGTQDYPDDRVNFSANYLVGDHSVYYQADYVDNQSTTDINDDGSGYEIDSLIYHTLSYSYATSWNSTVSAGINNLTDEQPRFDAYGGYNGSIYDIIGRSYWMSYNQRF